MKLVVVDGSGNHLDRLSPWAQYVTCGNDYIYEHRFWNPQQVSYFFVCCRLYTIL